MSWGDLQDSWDRQQEDYLPDREHRFAVLVELVEAQAGPDPRVLDLACGTGSITARVLKSVAGAQVVAADIDPALLAIARGTFSGDPRVSVASTDLGDPRWSTNLPAGQFDAVLTATALHWLQPDQLRRLYVDLASRPALRNATRSSRPGPSKSSCRPLTGTWQLLSPPASPRRP